MQRSGSRAVWPLFCAALVSLGLSVAALVAVLVAGGNDRASAAAERTVVASTLAKDTEGATLYYSGTLPGGLSPSAYAPADSTHAADIAFTAPQSGGVAVRDWVLVVSMFTGVDALSVPQYTSLLAGDPSFTWDAAGGVGGLPKFARVDDPAGAEWLARNLSRPPALHFASYADLLVAMALPGNGIAAWMPLDELRPPAVPLAYNGTDIVLGTGDVAAWPFAERMLATGLTDRGRAAVPGVETAIAAKPPVVTRVVATGDVLMSRCTLTRIKATGDYGSPLRNAVGQYLFAADLALTSLDASIQDIGEPLGCIATTNLTSPPQVIEALTLAGIDEATVATNHVFDCGTAACGSRGFIRMLDLLHGAGIKTVGGGKNLDDAFAPAIFEVNGVRFGIIGVDDIAAEDLEATDTDPGTAPMDDSYANEKADLPHEPAFYKPPELLGVTRLEAKVRALRATVDVVIVQLQSGTEETHDPSPRSIKALRAAAAAGADLVIGNQAHWVQAVEMRGSAFVAYALGNFIFDQVHSAEFTQGYLVEATFLGKRLATVRLLPYQIMDQYHPEFLEGAARRGVLQDVFTGSKSLPSATP